MMQWKAAPRAILLSLSIASAAHGGGAPDLAGHAGFGDLALRVSLVDPLGGRSVVRELAALSLYVGPVSSFGSPLVPSGGLSLHLFPATWAGHVVDVVGTRTPKGARVMLVPDSGILRDELAEAVALLCERVHGAGLCIETLAGLEPRLGHTRVVLRARTLAGQTRGRLRGRFQLRLVDPATEEVVVRASFAFRSRREFVLWPFDVGFSFGGTFISLGNPDTDPAP